MLNNKTVEILERCLKARSNNSLCNECPYTSSKHCSQILAADVLNLIREKDCKIAGLEAERDMYKDINKAGQDFLRNQKTL